eukprot:7716744-Alexandrium_andersonii.AAC.1
MLQWGWTQKDWYYCRASSCARCTRRLELIPMSQSCWATCCLGIIRNAASGYLLARHRGGRPVGDQAL